MVDAVNPRLFALNQHLKQLITDSPDGFLPFEKFMNAVLYTPNLGYYTATRPVGSLIANTDFITAPEMSALFGYTVAQAIMPCFTDNLPIHILECGAGTGKLAKDILDAFKAMNIVVEQYDIIELSNSLKSQQYACLKEYACVRWLNTMPETFSGVILANELLDSLPVEAYILQEGSLYERGVMWDSTTHTWQWTKRLSQASLDEQNKMIGMLPIETFHQPYYEFEYGKQASAWISTVADCIERGIILLIDYGFSQAELYHPQRIGGTLMSHRLHQSTTHVLSHVGEADITAHINFTAIAKAAMDQGMETVGFVNQARFLINADIASIFIQFSQLNMANSLCTAQLSQGLQLLMNESEMGEIFKVLALSKHCISPKGFDRADRSHRLFIQ